MKNLMKRINGGNSMKKDFEKFNIPTVKKIDDKAMSKIVDKIMNTPLTRDFVEKYNLSNKEIMDNFLPLLICAENQECCRNCKGYEDCKLSGVKGYYNVPIIDFYGTISTEFKACVYQEERNLFIYRDFDDEKLKWSLKLEDTKIPGRVSLINLLGDLTINKNTKGIFIHGENGVGKSYLAICCANNLVKRMKKEVAYVSVKDFISSMTQLIYSDKTLFEEKLEIIKNAPYLFLDGLGNEKISKFTRDDILLNIFEYRKNKGLKNIVIISKYDFNDLRKLYKVDNDLQAKSFVDLIKYLTNEVELVGLNNYE